MNKLLLVLTVFLISPFILLAQTRTVKGKVVDEAGAPVANVNVIVKGSKKATQTDKDGNFSISVTGNQELTFTSIGYAAKTVASGSGEDLSVQMQKEAITAEDVVVIGYQTVKRKDLLASVSSVSSKDLRDIPINSAAEALNGRLAGVTATTSEGSPDAQIRIRVRGGMSITGDNSPLYIIDGVQVENGLNSISPQDIQSIDVLKDAAATAIYGARGANGVIVITTKTGRPGRLLVTYNGFVGVKFLPKKLKVLSPYDFVIYQSERSRGNSTDSTSVVNNYGTWNTLADYQNVDPVDWQKEVFGNTGIMTTQNVSASGGTSKLTYNFGYTYNNDKAVVLQSSYKRHLLNLKVDYKITPKLKAGISTRYSVQNVYGAGVSSEQGTSYNRLRNAVKYKPFLSAGQDINDQDPFADPNVGNGLILVNPILLTEAEYRRKTTDNFNFTANASYQILKNLSFKTTFGYEINTVTDRQFSDSLSPYSNIQGGKLPIAGLDTAVKKTLTNSNVLTYSIKGFRKKHDLDVLIGQETYELKTTSRSSLFRNYPQYTSPDQAFENTNLGISFTGYPRLGKTRYTNLSFFGRISYAFQNKYFVSFNMRADGASKFGPGNKWGYFPAGSIAWRVKQEKFMQNIKFISDLKFRFGYGQVGNNRINDYLFLTTFSNDGRYYYGLNNQSNNGYYPTSLTNPDLRWESTINRNYGVDIGLFKDRVSLSVDIYNNSSKDLLLNVPIASTYGYTTQLQNIGKTSNKGVDIQLNAAIVRKKNFTWSANFNISSNKNKVVALGVNQPFFYPAASWGVNGQPTDYITRIGDPVGSMWGLVTDGFYSVDDFNYTAGAGGYGLYTLKTTVPGYGTALGNVQPGAVKFKDLNGDGVITLDDRKIIGNPTPKFTGGLNQQFTYKNWDASIFLNFSYGNDIYNANKIEFANGFTPNSNLLSIMEGRWRVVTPTGETAQFINASNQVIGIDPTQLAALNANATIWQPARGTGAAAFIPHSWAIEDGSFLRINNITLGYSLPVSKISRLHMSKLRFYITANNLAVLTSYSGYDPEVSVRNSPLTPGLDYSAYPKSRSFIFGINAAF
jgi:TonB-dependent starch-binding outer membrane protein SusC